MVRLLVGIVLGVVAWFVVSLGIAFALRAVSPGLSAQLAVHATVATLAGRLVISFVGSLIAGALAATVGGSRAALIAGIVLLAIFVPYHLFGSDMSGKIWTSYPLWYHLTFFVSLVALPIIGARFARR
jgi:hypothetical protein